MHPNHHHHLLHLAVLFSLVECGIALASNRDRGGFPSFPSIPNPFSPPPEPELSKAEKGELLLKSLNLESSSEPKVFYTDPKRLVDIVTAIAPFVIRLGSGAFADGYKTSLVQKDDSKYAVLKVGDKQLVESCSIDTPPALTRGPIILYEFEGCPFCRKVREAVSMLSLEVEFRPCPQESSFRKEIKETYGARSTFPFMRDPNTGVEMFESDDIIKYLFRTYSDGDGDNDGNVPSSLNGGILTTLTAGFGLLPRANRGGRGRSSDPPPQPLIVWSAEGSPYAKIVKEELCELQIAHLQISCPRGSPQRQRMFEKTGRFQIPYLEDPNTGVAMYESSAIIEYINAMYAVEKPNIEYM